MFGIQVVFKLFNISDFELHSKYWLFIWNFDAKTPKTILLGWRPKSEPNVQISDLRFLFQEAVAQLDGKVSLEDLVADRFQIISTEPDAVEGSQSSTSDAKSQSSTSGDATKNSRSSTSGFCSATSVSALELVNGNSPEHKSSHSKSQNLPNEVNVNEQMNERINI